MIVELKKKYLPISYKELSSLSNDQRADDALGVLNYSSRLFTLL